MASREEGEAAAAVSSQPSSSRILPMQPDAEHSDSEERRNDPSLYELPPFPKDHPIKEQPPPLAPADTNATYGFTYIDGIRFPAMVISGEPRIPLQMFKRKFPHLEYEEYCGSRAIDYWIMELNIYQHNANLDQARELKSLSEELDEDSLVEFQMISQTDTERLLGKIRLQSDAPPVIKKSTSLRDAYFRIPIRHNMVGDFTQEGFLYPERKGGRCIQCSDCNKFFEPDHFVMHSHSDNQENARTVHWGYSPDCWRFALYLDAETERDVKMATAFENFCFGDEGYEEDEYYPQWWSIQPEEEEPAEKKRREEPEVLVELSPEVVSILEAVVDMPQICHNELNCQDEEMLSAVEEQFHSKATADAMDGKIFDPIKGQATISEADLHERALEMYRSQQPHMPDPESFPPKALEHNGTAELQHMIETLKLLESTYPDGKPPPAAQMLIDHLRNKLQNEAYQIQQHQLVYCTLLSAYKMLNLLWRTHSDPSQPLPDAGDFAELAQKMMALDPMHFLGSPNQKEQPVLPPMPTEAELSSAATMSTGDEEPTINWLDIYAKLIKNITASPLKMENLWSPTMMPLLTPESTLQSLMKLNGWNLGSLNGGLNGASGSKTFPPEPVKMPELNGFKMPELNGLKMPEINPLKIADLSSLKTGELKMPEVNGLKTSPNGSTKLNGLLPSSLLMPGLFPLAGISPKALDVDGLTEEYNRLRNSLFNPLLLGLQTPQ